MKILEQKIKYQKSKNEQSLFNLWDNLKQSNVYIYTAFPGG